MTDIEFEQIIIKTIYANPEVSGKIIPELDTGWFTNVDHKYIVNAILEYNSKFSAVPNAIEVKRLLSDQRTVDEFEKCMSINDEDVNTPYILDEIQNFIRKRLGRQVCMDYNEYCSTGKSKGSFADEMAYAETFTFDTKVGFSFFEEPEVIFNDIITNERLYPTGCRSIDEMIVGGLYRKSISLILGSTYTGKTLFMCSSASALLLAGLRVLYVSFEDSEVKIGQRIMQNLFDINQTELRALSKEAYKKLWMKNTQQIGHNKLVIKEYSEGCINALALKALIRELRDKRGFVPDVLIVDYIGCMIPNGRPNANENDNSKLREICAQVRSIGMEMDIPVLSAAQSNRGGYGKGEIGLDDAADSFGQTMKADVIFGVTQSPELKEGSMYLVKLLKTRYGQPKCPLATIGVDIGKQRIFDLKTFNNAAVPTQGANIFNQPQEQQSVSASNIEVTQNNLNTFEF